MIPLRVIQRSGELRAAGQPDEQRLERRAVERVLAGEPGAFRVLVERHQRSVYAIVRRLVGSADAEDLTQQAFLAAYDALGDFEGGARFSPWLYRIAVNLAKDHLKSKKRGELPAADPQLAGEAAFAGAVPSPDARAIAHEREQLLERALATLSFDDRNLLVLKDIEELPYHELKQVLGRPVTALKIRVIRARARLKDALSRLAGEGAL